MIDRKRRLCYHIFRKNGEIEDGTVKILSPEELYRYNYSVQPINSLRQYWRFGKVFSCLGRAKTQNIFVFLDGCSAVYTDAEGRSVEARAGELIYAPEGVRYTARFFDFEGEGACTVGINFRLFSEEGEALVFGDEIKVFRNAAFRELAEEIDRAGGGTSPCYALMKAGLYGIISILGSKENTLADKYKVIGKGIEALEGGSFALSIEDIAASCNVSAGYFRRLFKEYSGLSPIEYRMRTKIAKAKDHLCQTQLNSSEIAELLSFADTSFFCRVFKARTGFTPEEYRRAHRAP